MRGKKKKGDGNLNNQVTGVQLALQPSLKRLEFEELNVLALFIIIHGGERIVTTGKLFES